MSQFEDFLKVVAEGKKDYKQNDPIAKKLEEVKLNVKSDLGSLFAQLSEISNSPILEEASQMIEEPLVEEVPVPEIKPASQQYSPAELAKIHTGKSFQQPDPDLVTPQMDAIRQKLKFMEQAIGKIAALGPGSGEVNLRYLDDVYRPSIFDGRFLRYNDTLKKFEFAEVNPHDIVYTTSLVTTATYAVTDADYYVGVNYAGPTTITLPVTPSSGRMIIIKDESGNAETYPITVLGNVDNDANGFIIQFNNGGLQLIYRNGWRVV